MNIPTDGYGLHKQILPNVPVSGYGAFHLIYVETTEGYVALTPELVSRLALSHEAVQVTASMTVQAVTLGMDAARVGFDDAAAGMAISDTTSSGVSLGAVTVSLSLADEAASVGLDSGTVTLRVDTAAADADVADGSSGVELTDS